MRTEIDDGELRNMATSTTWNDSPGVSRPHVASADVFFQRPVEQEDRHGTSVTDVILRCVLKHHRPGFSVE